MDLKEQHDQMLADKPSGVEHDTESCPFCNPEQGGDMSGTTYTEEDLKAAVEEAVAEALAPFQESANLEALQAAIDEAIAPIQAQVEELQNQLDTATLRAEKAEKDYADLVALLEAAKAEEEAKAALEARKAERLEAVKDLGFSEDWVNERLDRWTAMADEVFQELLDTWKAAIASKNESGSSTSIPDATAMTAGNEADRGGDKFATFREVSRLGLSGVDVRRL